MRFEVRASSTISYDSGCFPVDILMFKCNALQCMAIRKRMLGGAKVGPNLTFPYEIIEESLEKA